MNLNNLKKLARAYVPSASDSIDNEIIELVLNQGALDVAYRTLCLPDSDYINVQEDVSEYNLSQHLTDYLAIDKPGIWWYDGSQWKKLNPATIEWLDRNITNWRDDSSDDPQRYALNGNTIILHPTPSTTTSNGLLVYYGKKPKTMTQNSHYPFGYNSEIPHLAILSECILTFWEWKAAKMLGKVRKDLIISKQSYEDDVKEKELIIKRRRDIEAYGKAKLQGRKARR
jgi:hypothetical protein